MMANCYNKTTCHPVIPGAKRLDSAMGCFNAAPFSTTVDDFARRPAWRRGGIGSQAFIFTQALSTLTSARMMNAFLAAQHIRRSYINVEHRLQSLLTFHESLTAAFLK